MNQYDVAGLLKTYSEQCVKSTNTKDLKRFVRKLKEELNYSAIQKLKVNNRTEE